MLPDIEIASQAAMRPITEVAARAGLLPEELIAYGPYKAKISEAAFARLARKKDGRLILVTAINPTPAGEGKTTTTIGLGQALGRMGKSAVVALREPSLGPVFGIKGGAAGGGYAQAVPMEDINLHFTGDIHAITVANNLLCAIIDNHIYQGNALSLDPRRICFTRVLDINDRELRHIAVGLGGPTGGVPREDSFCITVASEVMAILCLADDLGDLRRRLGNILVGYTYAGEPVFCRDLRAEGAMTALLRDALQPNLVQTLENTPVLIHGGPFANIAHGCNSVRATRLALKLADYTVTEAGFGSDLGAEKFFDIKCRAAGLRPDCAVLVATARALKYNGGVPREAVGRPDPAALERGLANLSAHIENLKKYGIPVVVAVNRFESDSDEELALIAGCCRAQGVDFALSEVFAKGGAGGIELAERVLAAVDRGGRFAPLYDTALPLRDKIAAIATGIYGAAEVSYTAQAEKELAQAEKLLPGVPVCIAKTQYSLSDDPKLLGRPTGHTLHISGVTASCGAGFAVARAGSIMTMPGLPKVPAAESIDVDQNGRITGLF